MSDFNIPESWELGSGLKDDYELVIDHSYFGTDANYQDGKQLLLIWEGHDTNDGSPAREQYSIGKGWETPDLGRTITGMNKINKNSLYGKIIENVFKLMPDLAKELTNRGDPMTSAIWEGLKFQMKVQSITFGKNLDPIERVMPVAWLGFEGVDTAPSEAPSAARGPSVTTAQSPSLPATPTTAKILERIAGSEETFEGFIEKALDIPEVMDNTDLRTLVSDDSNSGFYAQVRG